MEKVLERDLTPEEVTRRACVKKKAYLSKFKIKQKDMHFTSYPNNNMGAVTKYLEDRGYNRNGMVFTKGDVKAYVSRVNNITAMSENHIGKIEVGYHITYDDR